MLPFKFTIVHVAGKKNLGPDAASRHPVGKGDLMPLPGEPEELKDFYSRSELRRTTLLSLSQHTVDDDMANDTSLSSAAAATINSVSPVITWDMVREETASDRVSRMLIEHIQDGFPEDCRSVPAEVRPFQKFANSLSIVDGVILMGHRIVIPAALREPILEALHSAHQGVSAMRARAVDSVYWPNISIDISRIRDSCGHCHRMAKSNAMQPPADITPPDYPFQKICSDYFTYRGKDYVVIVDRYSNWPMVFRSESGAHGLVKRLRESFVTFGIPEEMTSDGGPQFTSGITQEFLKSWGVRHRITSVANPHANCRAELGVKTVKRMLADNVGPSGSLDVDKFSARHAVI
uniref:uncharacterized protein K02A2.6-like n=1 Tax=Styela clava TaxID=7725 RepID=UPI001939419E|nr:uncharacterized protein K02A2.6-like [Styela clava]